MHFRWRNQDKGGDAATQIQERVEFDPALAPTELCPRKQRQAEIDRRGVECVDGLVQVDAKVEARIQIPSCLNEYLPEIGKDAPVPCFVGVGECTAPHASTNAEMVEFCRLRTQTGLNVA
jgi:hypothetical protein